MKKYSSLIITSLVCLYFWYYTATYTDWHFIDNVNLIFHEAGHTIFFFLGMFGKIAAGSGFQFALPALIAGYFFYNKQYVSGSYSILWTGQNLLNISIYARDAAAMQLDLLGGDNVIHDWNYLLGQMNLLNHSQTVGTIIYASGVILMFVGTGLAIYFSTPKEENILIAEEPVVI